MVKFVRCFVLFFILFLGILGVVKAEDDSFKIIVKTSDEAHLKDGFISYVDMGINSGPSFWGTSKFLASTDGGKTWFYAYCLNNDLYVSYDILNKEIQVDDKNFNYDNLEKILYYGYGGEGYNSSDYEYIRKHSYYIWMPYYDINNTVLYWHENWTDDLAYVLTHLALSYAYYHDVLGLSSSEADARGFYGVFESEDFYGTKAKSVAKLWYEYLIEKPDLGIDLYNENNEQINVTNDNSSKNLEVELGKKISIKGNDISSPIGGKIEFIVPKGMKCEVIGNQESATLPGEYFEGEKLVLGNNQSFILSLVEIVDSIEFLKITLTENYNVFRLDGGVSKDGNEYQDIVGLYKNNDNKNNFQVLGISTANSQVAKVTINKKILLNDETYKISDTYYFGIFEDNQLVEVLEMKANNEDYVSKTFYFPYNEEKKYIIKETDEEGNIINNNNLKIEIDKDVIVLNDDNLEITINVVNNYSMVVSPDTGDGMIIVFGFMGVISLGIILLFSYKLKKNKRFA